jgi:hypothetical protein
MQPTSSPRLTPSILACVLFTAAYLAAATIAALVNGNGEFIFYILVMLLLVGLVSTVYLRVGLTAWLLWAMTVWGAAHMAGGLLPVPSSWPISGDIRVLYSWWIIPHGEGGGYLKYDHVVHAYGFGVTTWLCWQALRAAIAVRRPTFGLAVLVAAAGMGFGALNEVVEFIATLLVPETNVGGYLNTGYDLVANLVGCTFAATLLYLWPASRSAGAMSETPRRQDVIVPRSD